MAQLTNYRRRSTVRKDFPILSRTINDKRLVFLDSAASSQRPQSVIDAMSNYYEKHHANVHRSVYVLAEEATNMYESARRKIARFINAPSAQRSVVRQKRHRTNQPGRPIVGPHQPQRGRRDCSHRDGTPRQLRSLAHAGRRKEPTTSPHSRD